jgi:2-polyprenyl-3-methyl-5-hydroxy-6-metoxy-1,4-benzoquinol methylase
MYKPIDTTPLTPGMIADVKAAYKAVGARFLQSSSDNPFYDYVKSVVINDAALDRHIRIFEIYAPYLKPHMRILDWGCRHAPDSCMMRTLYPDLELFGCDFMEEDFSAFHQYARLSFTKIEHQFKLPYDDGSFDAVVSGGVLEHVAFEHESIRELWRVLREDGLLFVNSLPNRTSLTENLSRALGTYRGHNRLYDRNQMKNTFLRSGFVIEKCGYHQVFPTFRKSADGHAATNVLVSAGARLNRAAERIPLINTIASNLFFVLRRVNHM